MKYAPRKVYIKENGGYTELSYTLMPRVDSNLFTVGNWKRRTKHRKGNEMIFH